MIDVVLDTNVLVAALFKPGAPNRLALRTVLANQHSFRICYSSQIMAEYEDVLSRPAVTARGLHEEAEALLGLIRQVGSEVVPKQVPAVVYPDADDRPFLEAAVYVGGMLLTNNLADFPFAGVAILAPEEFLAWWEARNT
ncbi:MAG: putative toxin-antitoxin system toxin component, PIN family [Eggerthellaceae bacterium]|nr:putative toxin-antitoxin system toxin component, PIN family [Eggerthellaceae bacterium]